MRDASGTITQPGNDYRVLGPVLMTDANRNRSAIAVDALGMVTATAVMGKDGAGEGDTLADPTTRLEYDLHRFIESGGTEPVFVHTFAREQHGASNPRFQPGRHVPDPASRQRWVGTGRTVFDNKGNRSSSTSHSSPPYPTTRPSRSSSSGA